MKTLPILPQQITTKRVAMCASLLAVVLLQTRFSHGQETNWIGTTGDWIDAGNWDNGIPSNSAYIMNNGLAKISGASFNERINYLQLGSFIDPTQTGHLEVTDQAIIQFESGLTISNGSASIANEARASALNLSLNGSLTIDNGRFASNSLSFDGGQILVRAGSEFNPAFMDRTTIGEGFDATLLLTDSGTSARFGGVLQIGSLANALLGGSYLGVVSVENDAHLSLPAVGSVNNSIDIQRGGELHIGAGGLAGTVAASYIDNNNVIRFNHTGSTDFATEIRGTGLVVSEGSGISTLSNLIDFRGTVQADAGQIILNGRMNEARTLRANSLGEIVYRNANIDGGFLRGTGIHRIESGGNSVLNGTTSFNSTTIEQDGAATLRNFANGGVLNNNSHLELDGFANQTSGVLNIRSTIDAIDFASTGVINVESGGSLMANVGDLFAGGGSRTYVAAGGSIVLGDVASTFELNGGLLVNNGTLDGILNINYGSLAKGVGAFDMVNVSDGGVFSPGNSPGLVTANSLTLGAGSEFVFEVRNASGIAGVDFDQVHLLEGLTLSGGITDLSAINLTVHSLASDNTSGLAVNFDPGGSYSFQFLTADGGIFGFDVNRFRIDSRLFLNAPNSPRFSVSQSGNSLFLNYSAVPEPICLPLVLATACLARRRNRFRP